MTSIIEEDSEPQDCIKIKLRKVPANYAIKVNKKQDHESTTLKAKLLCLTLEKVINKKVYEMQSQFIWSLKINHTREDKSPKRNSFYAMLKNSFTNRMTLEDSLSSKRFSFIDNHGSSKSTMASTIFEIKEFNPNFQNNSFEWISEIESIYSEDSQINIPEYNIWFKSGLQKLHQLFEKKHFRNKIDSLYRLITFNYWDSKKNEESKDLI